MLCGNVLRQSFKLYSRLARRVLMSACGDRRWLPYIATGPWGLRRKKGPGGYLALTARSSHCVMWLDGGPRFFAPGQRIFGKLALLAAGDKLKLP